MYAASLADMLNAPSEHEVEELAIALLSVYMCATETQAVVDAPDGEEEEQWWHVALLVDRAFDRLKVCLPEIDEIREAEVDWGRPVSDDGITLGVLDSEIFIPFGFDQSRSDPNYPAETFILACELMYNATLTL